MKLAFVIPWFGAHLHGGAEGVCLATARRLQAAGVAVEVLTTCIRQLRSDWSKNYHAPGVDTTAGLTVRRFSVGPRDTEDFLRINEQFIRRRPLLPQQQAKFIREMIRCDDLTSFIDDNRRHYVYVFIPYLFSTTYWGVLACPESSIIIPCLHDEGYAYADLYRPMFERARGLIFHCRAEMNLANRLYRLAGDSQAVIGAGMETATRGDGDRFRDKYLLDRFILYIGRKDRGKNVPLLIHYFCRYKDRYGGDLKLVLLGDGPAETPEDHEHDVIDLGTVSDTDKRDACAAACALCQPSVNESFSLVLMEAWLNEKPVLVHGDCAPTREHCLASGGGLYFTSFEEFAGCLHCLQEREPLTQRMGRAGRSYVLANYTWDHVIDKYLAAFRNWGFRL